MKIAFVVHQYPPRYHTGTEIYAHRLALLLRGRGHDVKVFTHEPDPERSTLLKLFDEPVDEVPVRRLVFQDAVVPNHALHDYYDVFLGKLFGRWLDEERPDVVHVFHLMGLGLSAIEECRARGIPVHVQLMDFWFLCPTVQLLRHDGSLCDGPELNACIDCLSQDNFGYQDLRLFSGHEGFVEVPPPERRLFDVSTPSRLHRRTALAGRTAFVRDVLAGASALVAPSRFLMGLFLRHGYREEHMIHVPYGVDPPPGPLDEVPVGGEGTVTFGFFGSVNPQKGLEVLVSAFRDMVAPTARLVVRGNMTHFPKYARRVRLFAELDPRINFQGPFPHGRQFEALNQIDVLVVPSVWYENTPFVVLEAFAARRPVVSSDLGGMTELVEDGVNGQTFRTGDPGALGDVLRSFVDDPGLLGTLAAGIGPVRTLADNADEFLALWEHGPARGTPAVSPSPENGSADG